MIQTRYVGTSGDRYTGHCKMRARFKSFLHGQLSKALCCRKYRVYSAISATSLLADPPPRCCNLSPHRVLFPLPLSDNILQWQTLCLCTLLNWAENKLAFPSNLYFSLSNFSSSTCLCVVFFLSVWQNSNQVCVLRPSQWWSLTFCVNFLF